MRNEHLSGTYVRMDNNGHLTPADVLALVKDYNVRIDRMEKTIEGLEKLTSDRGKTSKVSKRKVSSS
jgi:hypothetical protein